MQQRGAGASSCCASWSWGRPSLERLPAELPARADIRGSARTSDRAVTGIGSVGVSISSPAAQAGAVMHDWVATQSAALVAATGVPMPVFDLARHRTTVRTEILAGCTTFLTMAYIMFLNPAILAE